MYISLNWVQELVGIQKLTIDELVERLTLTGFEIESVTTKQYSGFKDFILDISFTANRSDVSNIRGLATEIITLFSSNLSLQPISKLKPLILLKPSTEKANLYKNFLPKTTDLNYLLSNPNSSLSNIYQSWQYQYSLWEWYLQKKSFEKIIETIQAHNVSNSNTYITLFSKKSTKVQIKESPSWIKKRLILMGFTPINNIIDTINYLLLETGQVFFVYDINSLKSLAKTSNLIFIPEYAPNNAILPVSDDEILSLNNDILTLTINRKIISIPGLVQHAATIVHKTTSSILLQGALYNAREIKNVSKKIGLKTDSSKKLEKQTDLNLLEQAFIRVKYLFWTQNIKFEEEAPEKQNFTFLLNSTSIFSQYVKQSQKIIKLSYQNVRKITGPSSQDEDLTSTQIVNILKLLNFKIFFETNKSCYVGIPLARQMDIDREVDIIEEIVRIIGFNNFKAFLNKTKEVGSLTKLEKVKRILRTYFLNIGFNESLHATLMKANVDQEVKLKNPISNESSILRTTLLDGILEKVRSNQKNIGTSFETFELGRIYNFLANGEKKEREVISGVFGAKAFRENWNNKNFSYLTWFEAKGFMETLFEKLNLSAKISWSPTTTSVIRFHPNLSTDVFIGSHRLGIFGQIHPNFALKHGLEKKLYLFEFSTELLTYFSQKQNLINYIPYSLYPISYLDLSFLINRAISADEIKEIIYKFGQPLLKHVILVDHYYNEPIQKEYCSLTFKLKFQSETRTLSNDEVLTSTKPIIEYLEAHYDMKVQE